MSCRFDPGLSAARWALVRAEQAAKGAAVDLGPTVTSTVIRAGDGSSRASRRIRV